MSTKIDEQSLDSFLKNVDLVSKQIDDIFKGKKDQETLKREKDLIDRLSINSEEKKKKKEIEEANKQQEMLKKGVKGKGEGKNYKYFCRHCFIEYNLESMTKCNNCNKDVWTIKQRHNDLNEKLEKLKEKKAKKAKRKVFFQNWLKSEKIVKSSNFKNYEKWDLYESSTDEEEKGEPIVPKNDPNFIALEKDLNDRASKMKKEHDDAEKLKNEGNILVSKGKYKEAIEKYTLGIDICKRIKVLRTNRALCYIKIEEYNLALKDCNKITEYFEMFEEELINDIDLYIKANLRKAQCLKYLRKYDEALDCINIIEDIKENKHEITNNKINDIRLSKIFSKIVINDYELLKSEIINEKSVFNSIKNSAQLISNENINIQSKNAIEIFLNKLEDKISLVNDDSQTDDYFKYINSDSFIKSIEDINKFIKDDIKLGFYLISLNGIQLIYDFISLKIKLEANINNDNAFCVLDIISSLINNNNHTEYNEKIIVSLNSLKLFSNLTYMILKNDNNALSIKKLSKLFNILERTSLIHSVRKSLLDIKGIENILKIMFDLFPFDTKIQNNSINNMHSCKKCLNKNCSIDHSYNLNNYEVLNLFMDCLTFMCNLMYNSNLLMNERLFSIKDILINNYNILYEKILNQLEKNKNIFEKETFIIFKQFHMLESYTSFFINLSVDLKFRNYLKDINDANKKTLINNNLKLINNSLIFQKDVFISLTNDIYQRSLSLLINLNINEDLTLHYADNNVNTAIEYYFNLSSNLDINEIANPDSKLIYCTIRSLNMLQKLVKCNVIYIINNDNKLLNLIIKNFILIVDIQENQKTTNVILNSLVESTLKCLTVSFHYICRYIEKNKKEFNICNVNKSIKMLKFNIFKVIYYNENIWNKDKRNIGTDCEVIVNSLSLLISLYTLYYEYNLNKEDFTESEFNIKFIISYCANKLNITRKNSAMLLAKMAKVSDEQLNIIRKNHGIDVLLNITSKLNLDKKK